MAIPAVQRVILMLALLVGLVAPIAACDDGDSTADQVGEAVEDAGDAAADAVEDTGDAVGDAAEKAGEGSTQDLAQ